MIDALGKNSDDYLEFSIIPEIIHNATLVHDDIEDRATSRRGAPPIYMKYSEDIAINLGSLLYFLPVVQLLDSKKLSSTTKERLFSVYMKEMLRVHVGQATDITWHNFLVPVEDISEDKYLQMVYNKTGVLARMACKLAAILAGADDKTVEILGQFGATIGVGFQLQDDFLNITPSKVADNKGGMGDDITEGKITLLVVYTLKKADEKDKKRLVEILKMHTTDRNLINEAIQIIYKYKAKEYTERLSRKIVNEAWNNVDKVLKESEAKKMIKGLADFLVERKV
jgi:geranylgeranyl pyrophosphate synthase